ncbi:hypothetical protein KSP39_PZI023296 [Platanthera zijinensis]|uniref:2Fe-2S ferredoxin-type domain-containing protein n=1 Tax=Platanthera zijinensis TaxID=2320716 RepID=A0AAP0AWD3_9ASPA
MATDLSISSSFALSLLPHSSSSSRRTFPATTKAVSQSAVGISDGSVASDRIAAVPVHRVTVSDRQRGVVHQFLVPEDQYILHTAESHNISLPFACRHGCCTSCAVRVKSGEIRQPEALGISSELKSKVLLICLLFNRVLPSSIIAFYFFILWGIFSISFF